MKVVLIALERSKLHLTKIKKIMKLQLRQIRTIILIILKGLTKDYLKKPKILRLSLKTQAGRIVETCQPQLYKRRL